MKKNKLFFRISVLIVLFIGLAFLLSTDSTSSTASTTESCQTCQENYYSCRININSCVDSKVAECRRNGGEESGCESQRQTFDEECSNACYQSYTYCWALCSPGTGTPAKDYAGGACGSLPQAGIDIDSTGNIAISNTGIITGSVVTLSSSYGDANPPSEIEFTVDGDYGSGTHLGYATVTNEPIPPGGNSSGYIGTFSFRIPTQYRRGRVHTLYPYFQHICYRTTATVLFESFPQTFRSR